MKILSLLLLILLAATVSHARPSVSVPRLIELLTSNNIFENEAELVEKDRLSIRYPNCRSWHLALETDNIVNFDKVPVNCKDYVEDYLTSTSKQYQWDSKTVCKEAYFYAKGLALKNDTVNVWIFDLDDTLLSSVPFYAKYGYGTEKYPKGAYWKWAGLGEATVLPETLHLYKNLLTLGIEPILLTERWKNLEEATLKNLNAAGFTYWKHVLFKPTGSNMQQVKYKSKVRKNLVRIGYNIIGNIGDQWTDLVEDTPGRAFKLPNPLFHAPS